MARPHNQTPVWLSHAKTAIRGCQLWRGSTPSDALPHELVSQFSSNERRNDPGSLRFGSTRSRDWPDPRQLASAHVLASVTPSPSGAMILSEKLTNK